MGCCRVLYFGDGDGAGWCEVRIKGESGMYLSYIYVWIHWQVGHSASTSLPQRNRSLFFPFSYQQEEEVANPNSCSGISKRVHLSTATNQYTYFPNIWVSTIEFEIILNRYSDAANPSDVPVSNNWVLACELRRKRSDIDHYLLCLRSPVAMLQDTTKIGSIASIVQDQFILLGHACTINQDKKISTVRGSAASANLTNVDNSVTISMVWICHMAVKKPSKHKKWL